jgi:hypothetical protein
MKKYCLTAISGGGKVIYVAKNATQIDIFRHPMGTVRNFPKLDSFSLKIISTSLYNSLSCVNIFNGEIKRISLCNLNEERSESVSSHITQNSREFVALALNTFTISTTCEDISRG